MTVFVRGIVKRQAYEGTFITQSTKVRKISGFKTSFHKNHKNGIFFRQQFGSLLSRTSRGKSMEVTAVG